MQIYKQKNVRVKILLFIGRFFIHANEIYFSKLWFFVYLIQKSLFTIIGLYTFLEATVDINT